MDRAQWTPAAEVRDGRALSPHQSSGFYPGKTVSGCPAQALDVCLLHFHMNSQKKSPL